MPSRLHHAVLRAYPLINARREYGGTRIVIDNRSVGEEDLCATLGLLAETNAEPLHPLLIAFADERMPFSLQEWEPPANTFPEFHGEWVRQPAVRHMMAGSSYPRWCLNGAPGAPLEPALRDSLAYTVAGGVPGSAADHFCVTGKSRIRTGVRAQSDADAVFARGVNWVAGWPLPAPPPPGQLRRAGSRVLAIRLLRLAQTDADIGEIEAVFRQDFGLAFKLLRFINSAANGLSIQVDSLQQAVMILGYARLTRWLALLVLASSEDPNQRPLMALSLRRGYFMERIGRQLVKEINVEELFMTGLFSLLDRIFAQPFEELLEQVNLPDAVSSALLNQGEPYGSLLKLAQAIEGEDPTAIRASAQLLGLKEVDVNRALLLAIRDADQIELH
jgi:EAL and modified HD-GYP domain-containing signal transduction protein